jgi:hypothetical protein
MNLNFTQRSAKEQKMCLRSRFCLSERLWEAEYWGNLWACRLQARNRFYIFHLGYANKKLIEKDQAVNYIQQKSQKKTPFVPYFKLCMKHPEIFPCFSNKKQSTWDFVRPKNISLHFLHVFKAQINPTSIVLCSEKLSCFFAVACVFASLQRWEPSSPPPKKV